MNPRELAESAALGDTTEVVIREASFSKYLREFLAVGKGLLFYEELDGLLPGYFKAKIVDRPGGS